MLSQHSRVQKHFKGRGRETHRVVHVDGLARHARYASWSSIRLEQAELRLVPEIEYDVPMEPTLTRGPHSPALVFKELDRPHSPHLSATHGHEPLK